MARTRRVKSMEAGRVRYHLVSRACNRQFLFRRAKTKDRLLELIRRAAEFSGIGLEACAVMDNHVHVLCTVVRGEGKVPEAEVVRRIRALRGDMAADRFAERCRELAAAGFSATLEAELERYRARMHDISGFMKTVKELFAIWFNREFAYSGSVWSGVFKSTVVEDGEYFSRCRRYIMHNPVRAGIVGRVGDYRWVWQREPAENEAFAGCLPAGGWTASAGRVAQLSEGKIYGSAEFVARWIARMGDGFAAAHVCAHAVGEIGFSSHGWRIADRAKCVRKEAVMKEAARG